MLVVGVLLALVVGLSLGLLGAGGSILTVPIFVYVLGYDAKTAVAMSLAVVGVVAFLGFLAHWRHRNVDVRLALGFSVVAVAGTLGGATVAGMVSGTVQLVTFAIVVLAAGLAMLRNARAEVRTARGDAPMASRARTSSHEMSHAGKTALLAATGIGVGFLTGLIGVGGGFLIVPALVLVAGVDMRHAVGTSLLVITVNALSGFAFHLGSTRVAWDTIGWFVGCACIGLVAGTRLSGRVPQTTLKQIFAFLLLGVSVLVLYRR